MKKLLIYLAVATFVLLVLFLSPLLIGNNEHLLIAYKQYTIELSINALIAIVLVSTLLMAILFKLIIIALSATRFTRKWLSGSGKNKRERLFYDGLFALALGNSTEAKASLEKLSKDEFHGFNYLALGQLALQRGKTEIALMWLDKAKVNDDPRSVKTAKILVANLHLQNEAPEKALEELDSIEQKDDDNVIKVRAKAMAMANQWQALEEKLPKWKKPLGESFSYYNEHIATNKFAEIASKYGALQLKEHWNTLPRQQRNNDAFRAAFALQLTYQGMHQDAKDYIVKWYKKGPLPIEMLNVIKQISVPQPTELIGLLETGIKAHPTEAKYYAALGHLAYRADDYALSEKALLKAIDINETVTELSLLADLYEKSKAYEEAMQTMRKVNALQS